MDDEIDYDKLINIRTKCDECGVELVYPTDNQDVRVGQNWEQDCPEYDDSGCKCRSAKVIKIEGKYNS